MANDNLTYFKQRHKFRDDVWGRVVLNDLEHDVIDTPEFQRLFRTSQLGFVELVYSTANHTRGSHSIGACAVSQRLMDHIQENGARDHQPQPLLISTPERVLIRLGALLHDISHVPLSHDVERKSHRFPGPNGDSKVRVTSHYGQYAKHDDYAANPLLFILLLDKNTSVLARVLRYYSKPFYHLLKETCSQTGHLAPFGEVLGQAVDSGWNAEADILPSLLFHLLVYERPEEAACPYLDLLPNFNGTSTRWHLGPESHHVQLHTTWYQPFRHDIIGNTLSADLLDYLARDCLRMGMRRRVDEHLMNYYVVLEDPTLIKRSANDESSSVNGSTNVPHRYRCAIDLYDRKRGTSHTEALNDVFRLLDVRHEIHAKAVLHRVVLSANAMLSRAMLLLKLSSKLPSIEKIVRLRSEDHALVSEDSFFQLLLDSCRNDDRARPNVDLIQASKLLRRVAERRVYRPLMIIPGDRLARHLSRKVDVASDDVSSWETPLRTFGALVDSRFYGSFFLFVSACIEGLLRNYFQDADRLCQYARAISKEDAGSEVLASAMSCVPSRVIIWTTPFKQLYKDPALVVRVEDWITRIDEMTLHKSSADPGSRFICDRVIESIRDADSKYATLWKLYVFISDGLFYTGNYQRILDAEFEFAKAQDRIIRHVERLSCAEGLLVAAFDAVWEEWSYFAEGENSAKRWEERLDDDMDAEVFKALVDKWISDFRLRTEGEKVLSNEAPHNVGNKTDAGNLRSLGRAAESVAGNEMIPRRGVRISTVDLTYYAHDKSTGPQCGDHCRDIRYKTAVPLDSDGWEHLRENGGEAERTIVATFEAVGVGKQQLHAAGLIREEFQEFVESYLANPDLRELCNDISANGSAKDASRLREFWRGVLPSVIDFLSTSRDDDKSKFANKVPETADEWAGYITRSASSFDLKSHVRKRIKEEMPLVVEFITGLNRERWPEVHADLRLRLMNEALLCDNNIKAGQILETLRRKWASREEG